MDRISSTTVYSSISSILLPVIAILMITGYTVPFRGTMKLLKLAKSTLDENEKSRRMKSSINYSLWHTTGIVAITLIVLTSSIIMATFPGVRDIALKPMGEDVHVEVNDITVEPVKTYFSYNLYIHGNITPDRDIKPEEIAIVYTLSTPMMTMTEMGPFTTTIAANTTVPIVRVLPLPDVSVFNLNISIVFDGDGNGIYETVLYSKDFSGELNDLYFPLEPRVDIKTGYPTNILLVKASAINLGEIRDDVSMRIKVFHSTYIIANYTLTPGHSLRIDENWSAMFSFALSGVYGDITVRIDLLCEGYTMDTYTTEINLHLMEVRRDG